MRHGEVAYGIEPNVRLLADAAKSYGFFNVNADSDGILRRATLLVRYQDRDYFPSLDFQAAKYFEQISDQEIVALISENGLDSIQFGAHNLPTDGNNTVLVNYAGPYGTYAQFSLADVLDGTVPPDSFRGKIVLVGATALGVGDICSTPFSQGDAAYMGVEFHANTVDNLLHVGDPAASFLRRGSPPETRRRRLHPAVWPGDGIGIFTQPTAAFDRFCHTGATGICRDRVPGFCSAGMVVVVCCAGERAGRQLCWRHQLSHDLRGT